MCRAIKPLGLGVGARHGITGGWVLPISNPWRSRRGRVVLGMHVVTPARKTRRAGAVDVACIHSLERNG
jgi:hypothetical protein